MSNKCYYNTETQLEGDSASAMPSMVELNGTITTIPPRFPAYDTVGTSDIDTTSQFFQVQSGKYNC